MSSTTKNILLVGQTPPPFGGQAMMIQRTLKGYYGDDVNLIHVRMSFSKDIKSISKFRISKVYHLLKIIYLIYLNRIKKKANILYYFPAGPRTVPIIRDIFILGTTRFLFKEIIFHFRAAGISTYIEGRRFWLSKKILFMIYSNPQITIRLSEYTPLDDEYLNSKKKYVIYNGIEDNFKNRLRDQPKKFATIRLLYIGIISKSKGILDLLNAFSELKMGNLILDLIGKFDSEKIQNEVNDFIDLNSLREKVLLHGEKVDKEKYDILQNSNVFVFPSFFESEALPGAIIEAMSFAKPIVATNWRGIPSLVIDGQNGFLVPIQDREALSEKIEKLCTDERLRKAFGDRSREFYLEKFTMEKYYEELGKVFRDI